MTCLLPPLFSVGASMALSHASGSLSKGIFVSFQIWITKLVALALACALFVLLFFDLRNGLLALESMHWRKAEGKVASVKIDKKGNRYVAEVTYEFSANGETVRGTRYGMLQYDGKRHFKTKDRAESWAQIGTPLTVRYHQDDSDRNIVVNSILAWLLLVSTKAILLSVSVLYLWPIRGA